MQLILSGRSWTVGADVGSGGFGQVKAVQADDGTQAVAKFVPNVPESEREELVTEALKAAQLEHVVPIIDSGVDDDSFVIVMPRADLSLRAYLQQYSGTVPLEDALTILSDIAAALVEIKDAGIVHRDLKPENVLRPDGTWVLCDFGIARFDATVTAPVTHKYSKTPQYAAPEQWLEQRATSASDVYTFGVMAYELLNGSRPFTAMDPAVLREQHISEQPAPLTVGPTRLRLLVEQCLDKAPEARPSPEQIVASLHKAATPPAGSGAQHLVEASYGIARQRTAAAAAQARLETEQQRRVSLFAAAQRAFSIIPATLREALEEHAPNADIVDGAGRGAMAFEATLGRGKIGIANAQPAPATHFPFDVIAYASISVVQDRSHTGYSGRSHSLWYCDPHTAGQFGWHELAFMHGPLSRNTGGWLESTTPYAVAPGEAGNAFMMVMGGVQLAWPVEELDRADLTVFIDRWLGWFAQAATGSLYHPTTMPEKPNTSSSYRRS